MRALAIAAFLLAFGLLGCGGNGDHGSGGAGEQAVRSTIESSAFSDDPASCRRLYTQEYLERMAAGAEGEAALRACEGLVSEGNQVQPREVEISDVRAGGAKASADVGFTGGTLDGQTITFALVEAQGDWRIDRMVKFVEFDRDRLLEGLKRQTTEATTARDRQLQSCMLERFEELDDLELQSLALNANPQGVYRIAAECAGAQEGSQEA
jgi:hypothetical protein